MSTVTPLILDRVAITLRGRRLIAPLSLVVRPGEAVTVMGPSGSGKSSLLAHLAGVLDPVFEVQGRVLAGDQDLTAAPPEARRFGMLFQDALLFPHLSVAGNLAFGLPADVRDRRERRRLVDAALAEAGMDNFGDRDPATLSGGQQARIALFRALLSRPRALLLDEPFSKLDAGLRQRIRGFLFEHAKARNLPVLLVTHDRADAEAAGGPIVLLDGGGP